MQKTLAIALAEQKQEIIKKVEREFCQPKKYKKARDEGKNTAIFGGCYGVNSEHCDNLDRAINIIKGE